MTRVHGLHYSGKMKNFQISLRRYLVIASAAYFSIARPAGIAGELQIPQLKPQSVEYKLPVEAKRLSDLIEFSRAIEKAKSASEAVSFWLQCENREFKGKLATVSATHPNAYLIIDVNNTPLATISTEVMFGAVNHKAANLEAVNLIGDEAKLLNEFGEFGKEKTGFKDVDRIELDIRPYIGSPISPVTNQLGLNCVVVLKSAARDAHVFVGAYLADNREDGIELDGGNIRLRRITDDVKTSNSLKSALEYRGGDGPPEIKPKKNRNNHARSPVSRDKNQILRK